MAFNNNFYLMLILLFVALIIIFILIYSLFKKPKMNYFETQNDNIQKNSYNIKVPMNSNLNVPRRPPRRF